MDISEILVAMAGPGAGVVVAALVLYGIYSLATAHLIPIFAAALKRHLDQIDGLISNQREVTTVHADSMRLLTEEMAATRSHQEGIYRDLKSSHDSSRASLETVASEMEAKRVLLAKMADEMGAKRKLLARMSQEMEAIRRDIAVVRDNTDPKLPGSST